MADPYAIKIFVPDGNPESIRIIDRMNWTGLGLVIPREKWDTAKQREELKRPGVYILYGFGADDPDKPTVYIGQADGVHDRLNSHIQTKEFWDTAIVFVSSSASGGLNRAHITWLEYALIDRANVARRCHLENGTSPKEPALAESEKAELQVFLKEVFQILPLVNMRVFEVPRTIVPGKIKIPAKDVSGSMHKSIRDTVIVPAQKEGFDQVFMKQNCWYAIRISGRMLDSIRYIAAYEIAPVSAIRFYAPVKSIEVYGDSGKYKLIFAGPPEKIGPVKAGSNKGGGVQGPFYTNLERLKTAKTVRDLYLK